MSVAAAGIALTLMKIEVTIDAFPGCPYLDHARNVLVTKFLGSPATDMLFWDDDVGADVAAVAKIARAKRLFVGGVYRKKADDPEWPIAFDADELWADDEGLIDTPTYLPTGFLRLNRAVFDVMPCTMYKDDAGKEWKGYFHCGVSTVPWVGLRGEDPAFGIEWRRRGGKCYLLPDLNLSHSGSKVWRGNWGNWMREQA